jgi:ribonuclease G
MKDPIGTKGARLSTEITLPSTYLVYHPYGLRNGVSQKIIEVPERMRLQQWMEGAKATGIIVRTVAQGIPEADLAKDYQYLLTLWNDLHKSVIDSQRQRCLWMDLHLPLRVLRDFSKLGFSKIYTNSSQEVESISSFLRKYFPNQDVELIPQLDKITAFSQLKIGTQFLNAMNKEVLLKSGGSIVIEQTESMVTIDVNTCGFIGQKNARDTILKTNLEAVKAIAYQIPLRELGGLIIIDFIDMESDEDKDQVYQELQACFKNDLMPTHILPMSAVGLVQMTRKRITESSPQKYFQSCPCCHIRGALLAPYVVLVKFLEALEKVNALEGKALRISARQDVLTLIQAHEEKWKSHSKLQEISWRYDPISWYHNKLSLVLCSITDITEFSA